MIDKNKTRAMTNAAIELGLLARKPCEVCGADKVHAHHVDYADHMNIRWLCHAHHIEEHRRLGTLGRPSLGETPTMRLEIRIDSERKREWERKAKEAGVPLSVWIRDRADAACDEADAADGAA
jgi:hypothetical protein